MPAAAEPEVRAHRAPVKRIAPNSRRQHREVAKNDADRVRRGRLRRSLGELQRPEVVNQEDAVRDAAGSGDRVLYAGRRGGGGDGRARVGHWRQRVVFDAKAASGRLSVCVALPGERRAGILAAPRVVAAADGGPAQPRHHRGANFQRHRVRSRADAGVLAGGKKRRAKEVEFFRTCDKVRKNSTSLARRFRFRQRHHGGAS